MLQGGEIIIILLLALVVLGPQRLPEAARKLGQWSVELRRAARDLRSGLEAEVGDLREIRREIEGPVDQARGEFKRVTQEMDDAAGEVRRLKWVGPDPKTGPTAEDAMKDLDEIEGESGKDAPA